MKIPDDIDIITELDRGDFVKLESPEIQAMTGRSLLIDGHWIAKSQIRTDFDGKLYVADWIYGREFE